MRYATEQPLILRVKVRDLIDANPDTNPQFCRYNSGAPRCSPKRPGRRSPRGPDTFVAASDFSGSPSKVVELVFPTAVKLPHFWEVGTLAAQAEGANKGTLTFVANGSR
jgi:hypothetical protein